MSITVQFESIPPNSDVNEVIFLSLIILIIILITQCVPVLQLMITFYKNNGILSVGMYKKIVY